MRRKNNKIMFLIFCLIVSFGSTFVKADCSNGAITSYSNKSICYVFVNINAFYLDAEVKCNEYGGHLVTIPNMFENLYLMDNAKYLLPNSTDFWIGANDIKSKNSWSWIDGTPFTFTDWDVGQPKNQTNFDGGTMNISSGLWKTDDYFLQKKAFVCSYVDNGTVPSGCPDGWSYFNGTDACYKAYATNDTWQNVEAQCVSNEAHLVSIHSSAENDFVAKLVLTNEQARTYIGLISNDNGTTFKWSDGTPLDYTNWPEFDYPMQHAGYNCGLFYNTADTEYYKTWYNSECHTYPGFLWTYVCKK